MTPPKRNGLHPFWSSKQALLMALALSIMAHVVAYIASHDWAPSWPAGNTAAAFDTPPPLNAVLLPATANVEPDTQNINTRATQTTRPGSRSATRSATVPATRSAAAKSVAVVAAVAADETEAATAGPAFVAATPAPVNERAAESIVPVPALNIAEPAPAQPSGSASPPLLLSQNKSDVTSAEPTNAAPILVFPERIKMAYRLSSSVADGIANFSWQRTGTHYELNSTIQATGIFVGLFVGTFRQTSRGEMTPDGIRPQFFSMQRGDAPVDTAEFNHSKRELKIIKHGETHLFALPPRMQDTQSFLFQLAQDADKLKTADDRIKVALTNARKLYDYQFRLIGQETLQTRMGELLTLHMKSDAADPEDVYEVWLSPKHYYLPVKVKFYMGRFLMEQTVTSISASDP